MAVLKVQVDSFGNLNKKNMTKKIMFSDKYGLTNAVLEGRKTQTRRIVPQSIIEKYALLEDFAIIEAKYDVGEVVAVAQAYRDCGGLDEKGIPRWNIIGQVAGATNAGWHNKMFVRADLMPHQIRITDVRVERLQDITDECCLKEGVRKVVNENGIYVQYYVGKGDNACSFENPREAFAHLINKVSKKDVWAENPYVFVYDFELVK